MRERVIYFIAFVVVAGIALLLSDNLVVALLAGGLAATTLGVLERRGRS